ncbi:MAG: YkgJ family cysteine cluster protein [Desulfobacterales bacterium]|nr:YkgJ family cysteine cluster protein [Desulfobacterales bacterium]
MNSTECKRCGTCCKKGGPSFHIEDRALLEDGFISAKYLYTIREGEPVRDNISERIVYAPSDIIKIKGQKNGWTCFFYDETEKRCAVYEYRPLECKLLKCRDTRDIERIFGKKLLTRKDIISTVEGLWDLVIEHDQRCSYKKIRKLIDESGKTKKGDLSGKVAELIEYDKIIRELVVKKGQLDSELLDFLFGRPLSATMNRR